MENVNRLATAKAEALGSAGSTRALLTCGVLVGPLFYVVAIAQILTRPGFDIRHHAISMLTLGDFGWVQVANFAVTGLLAICCALGMRRVLHGRRGGTWGPALIAIFGAGLLVGAAFHPDPGLGFPPGTPDTIPTTMSGHAALHMVGGTAAFLAVIADCFVLARLLSARARRRWVVYCVASAIGTAALFAMSMSILSLSGILLACAGVVAFGWVSAVAARLRAGV